MVTRTAFLAAILVGSVVWQPGHAQVGVRPGATPAGDDTSVRRALDSGAYDEAERLAASGLAAVELENGRDTAAYALALDLVVAARISNGRAASTETVRLAQQALTLKERRLGPAHAQTAVALHNLASVYLARGELHAAMPLYERAATLRLQPGANPADLADTLTDLALTLIKLDQLTRARGYIADAQQIREGPQGGSAVARAHTEEVAGLLDKELSRYAQALRELDRSIALRHETAPDHPGDVDALITKGDVLLLMGDVPGAQQQWTTALAVARARLRSDHPLFADVLRRLGFAAFSLGDLSDARQLRDRALEVGEAALAPCDRERTALLQSAAISRQYDGQYAEARSLLRRARRTIEECSARDPRPPDARATIIYNEAALEDDVGDLAAAERLYSQALAVWTRGFGPEHPLTARGLDALAQIVSRRGQLTRARSLYARALAIRRKTLGPTHPLVAWTLANLAATEMDARELTAAARHLDEGIALYRQSGTSDDPDHFARMLNLRGRLAAARGNIAAARESIQEALAERERVFGAKHPLASETRAALAQLDAERGDTSRAVDEALTAERDGRDHLRFTLRYLPERQALAYAGRRPHAVDVLVSIAASDDRVRETALDQIVQSRAVLLDEFAARARSTAAADPAVRQLRDAAQSARERFANLVVRSLSEPVDRRLLDEARDAKEEAERALAERSADARAEAARTAAGIDQVRKLMPQGSALVSFVRFDRPQPRTPTGERRGAPTPSYAAFIVRADAPRAAPVFISLGSAAALDGLIRAWKSAVLAGARPGAASAAGAAQEYRRAGGALRTALWDPLAVPLSGVRRIFLVPDGMLNIVNVASLPTASGRYLMEDDTFVIHYLSTERDLLVSRRDDATMSALVVGRPAFERTASAPRTAALRAGCDVGGSLRFADLPGTGREATEVSRLWAREGGGAVNVLTGAKATETAFKRALGGQRVVHLATHGFFLEPGCLPGGRGTRAVGGVVAADAIRSAGDENPLLLSGLAFAGANRRSASGADDDGILTAEEIAGLNLQGIEWAVLSACDTGLGEIRAGEGVFGLRRAFQIAGARTVIMSLWSVDDEATRGWMRALYEGRLMRHLDTADAVKQASLAVLRQRRAAHLSTHPFYWAAFVAAGDWR